MMRLSLLSNEKRVLCTDSRLAGQEECIRHGAKVKRCSHEGYTNQVLRKEERVGLEARSESQQCSTVSLYASCNEQE